MGIETALVVGGLGSVIGGAMQAGAAKSGAQAQADAARYAADLQAQATAQQREDLQPYAEFGSGFMGQAQQAVGQTQQLFNDPMSIMQNPMFAAIMEQNQRDVMQNAAVRGRLGTGGTQQHLLDTSLRTGFDVLNQERQAQMANVSMLGNLVGMGQSAAAGQGAGTMQGAALQGGLLTDAAAAQAAGSMGAANAWANTAQNLGGLGMTAALLGSPAIGAGVGGGGVVAPNYPVTY